jgi:hypothetical protein
VNLSNQKLEEEGSIYLEFERIWNKYFSDAINNIEDYLEYEDEFLIKKTFKEVREHLITAVNGTEIKAVNTLSKDVLDYESGEKKYIVIGGNKLSRGFTLEGLSINYFVRSTNFSDTLLQMGRWFGYRPGYIDCCKLFTTAETIEKFNLCTWTIEELESEFKKLVNSDPKKTPIEYATKVLTHPGVLKITRPSILKNSVLAQWSFEDRLVQTTSFILTKDRIEQSWSSFKSWIKNHDFQKHPSNDFMVLNAPSNVLFNLLSTQKVYPSTDAFDIEAIQRYISLANDCGKLMNWTIAIKTTGQARIFNGEVSGLDFGLQLKTISTSLRYRKEFLNTKIFKAYGASSNIITSGKDLSVSLTKDQIESAETEFKRIKPDSSFPERIYRERISDTQGVLIIYLMDLEKIFTQDDEMIEFAQNENLDLVSTPLIGFALGFPPIDQRISGNYLLNKRILENIKNAQNEELDNLPFLNEGDEDEFESINEDIN